MSLARGKKEEGKLRPELKLQSLSVLQMISKHLLTERKTFANFKHVHVTRETKLSPDICCTNRANKSFCIWPPRWKCLDSQAIIYIQLGTRTEDLIVLGPMQKSLPAPPFFARRAAMT